MSAHPLGHALRQLRRLADEQAGQDLSDAALLQRFRAGREETAFALLVQRHGPMVLGVCRRVLGDRHEAEDAFQATFLVLLRRAGAIHRREALGGWLHRVAYRVAARARDGLARRRAAAVRAAPPAAAPDPADLMAWGELRRAVEEELHRLPAKYRVPLVLCCLEGKTHEQAGRELRWPKSSVTARLERARQMLHQRLGRRGFVLPATLLAALLAAEASSAAVPAALVLATVRLALQVLHGEAAAAPGVALAEGVLRGMARVRLATAALVVLTLGLAAAGAAALAQTRPAGEQAPPSAPAPRTEADKPPREAGPPPADPDQAGQGAIVSGTVADQDGKPVAGARVWLREGEQSHTRFRSADADAQGRFRFAEVPAGSAAVVALAPGHSFAGLSREVQAGQVANDLKLVLTPPRELRLIVTGQDGKPVEGAVLDSLSWKTPRADWFWLPPEVRQREKLPTPTSDRDGILVVPDLPRDAVCQGRVRHPDFARCHFEDAVPGGKPVAVRLEHGRPLTIAVLGPDDKPATGATVTLTGSPATVDLHDEPVGPDGTLTVRLGKATDVTIMARHPELISPNWDRIDVLDDAPARSTFHLRRRAKARGRVVDEKTGEPVPGVQLGLSAGFRQIISYAQTDAAGRFEIVGPEGQAAVQVMSGGRYWAKPGAEAHVLLDPSRTAEAPDLTVKQLPRVHGTVVLPDGRPAARALVVDRTLFHGSSVLTDREGRFEFPLEEKEEYLAVAGRHLTERLSGGTAVLFEDLEKGKEVRVQLQPETELRGEVTDRDGKPRAGVQVWLRSETRCDRWSSYKNEETATTDGQGRYRFPGLDRALRYQVALDSALDRKAPHSAWVTPDRKRIDLDPLQAPAADYPPARGPVRQAAPELGCQAWFNSPPLRLEALRGKVVLLDFWATWCGACVADLPQLQTAHEAFADKGLVVIGVHHNSVPAKDVEAFLRKRGVTFPVGLDDPDGLTCGRYNVSAYPTRVLIGRDGKVVQADLPTGDLLGAVRRAVLYGGADD
jgi:RNA polymerase sigma factor (sigma-70 family)